MQACSWPHTHHPPSWADRKIPDIVVQRWLQAGRQQEVGAGEGGPESPEHLEASGPDRPCSWRATCLHECLWVKALRVLVNPSSWPGHEDSPMVGLVRGAGGVSLLAFKFQLWKTLVDSLCRSPQPRAAVRPLRATSY